MGNRFFVLVVLAVGTARGPAAHAQPAQAQTGQPKSTAAPGLPTEQRVQNLRQRILEIDRQVDATGRKLPALKESVHELVLKLSTVQSTDKRQDPPKTDEMEKPQPQLVQYRPPLLRQSDKATNTAFVCRDGRLFVLDLGAMNAALDQARAATSDPRQILRKGRVYQLSSGDYDITVADVLEINQGNQIRFLPTFEATLKTGRQGSSLDEIGSATSDFAKHLAKLDPAKEMLQFMVYPDSFELFRASRAVAWKARFDLNWIPREPGAKVTIGSGKGSVQ